MELTNDILKVITFIAAGAAALLSILLFRRLHWPSIVPLIIKLYTSALSPVLAAVGLISTAAGLVSGSFPLAVLGLYDAAVYGIHIYRVTRPPGSSTGYLSFFSEDSKQQTESQRKNGLLERRLIFRIHADFDPRLEQNLPYSSVPGTGRKLLCDLWEPAEGAPPSGTAFIYLHGSAWCLLDKDLGTRPFFTHLASLGHVIMDVAIPACARNRFNGDGARR